MGKIYGDRWETTDQLGSGGQAETFLARDRAATDGAIYVLKRLRNPARIGRFRREAKTVSTLDHPNIVHVVDYNVDTDDRAYIVMEYCAGGSLGEAAETAALWRGNPATALVLFQQICEGVAYAHQRGVIHRDIKPDNIFLRRPGGPAVVGDFGLCATTDDETRLTGTAEQVGSRFYMAPELADGRAQDVTTRCDTYSLGKVLYWLIAGEIFDREKHRERRWDLKGRNDNSPTGWNNVYLEHVNRLLDLMIVADPLKRREVANILILARKATGLVSKEYNPVTDDFNLPCNFCGAGVYVLRARDGGEADTFGLKPYSGSDWRIYVCDECGHTQIFRTDMAKRTKWWEAA